MSNQIVIKTSKLTVLFDEVHDPMPYIKRLLRSITDEKSVDTLRTASDAIAFITQQGFEDISIYTIDRINPKEENT